MHKYLRAIGFSTYLRQDQILPLLNDVHEHPDNIECSDLGGVTFVTMEKDFMENSGIGIFGEYDQDGRFRIEYYYPYVKNPVSSGEAPCTVNRHADRYAFSVLTDEARLGIALIYYLINTNAYLDMVSEEKDLSASFPYHLSAMSVSGTILLPIKKSSSSKQKQGSLAGKRLRLIEDARDGDVHAMEKLASIEMRQFEKASRRLRTEDLYTIVDTNLMPTGTECDMYTILGEITGITELANPFTREELWQFTLTVNDITFPLVINKQDLCGEPAIGRRFHGDIWLQGLVRFPE